MDFYKSLFLDIRYHFGNKFFIFFSIIFLSALLDLFAVISFLPIIEILFPGTIIKNDAITQFLNTYLEFLNLSNNIPLLVLLIITIFLVTRLLEYLSLFFTYKMSQNVKFELQKKFVNNLNNCFLSYFINIRAGEIINLYSREIGFVAEVYRLFFIIVARILIFLIILPFLIYNEFILTVVTSLSILITVLMMRKFYNMVEKTGAYVIDFHKKVSSSFTFFISNIFSIKKSLFEDKNSEIIKGETKKLLDYQVKQINYNLLLSSFVEPFYLIFLIFAFFIVFKINNNIPAEFLINMGFLLRFARHFLSIQSFYIKILNWKRYVISKKFHDNLLKEYSSTEKDGKIIILEKIKNININDLCIAFENKEIIKKFNLNLSSPFFLRISGDNGSGKTSLSRSLLGLIEIKSGKITYNNTAVNMIDKGDLSKKITILDKNPLIIKGSLLDNIAMGSKKELFDKSKILSLVSHLNLDSIFNNDNLDMETIEENGKNLSQGQQQKISIIRSIINKYEIIIIDEGTSNIDEKDEKKIIEYLYNSYKNNLQNTIFISHKSNYDEIFKQKINLS